MIEDLSYVVELKIIEKVREDFRSRIELLKIDIIVKIISSIGGLPQHKSTEDGYEEFVEDFKVVGYSGEDIIE